MYPVLFQIGSFKLHSWGLMLMLGFLLAAWRGVRNAPRYGMNPEVIWDCALIGLLGGVLGGRLAYVLQNLSYFTSHPAEILMIWTGGMTSFGGFLGGIGAGLWAAKRRGMNLADGADLAAVSLPIGYGIGRIGCFLNGCCYGSACTLPWAMRFHDHGSEALTPPSHPTQLYSVVAALAMYLALVALEKQRRFPGQLIVAFVLMYGVYRFVIEFWRAQATAEVVWGGLTSGQWASVVTVLLGAVGYVLAARRRVR